jgi:hypothetical protein
MARRSIEEMPFKEWCNKVAFDIIGKKIMKFNDDHVILVCGDEGKRKSTFTLATYCQVLELLGKKPQREFLCYSWDEYRLLNLFALKNNLENVEDKDLAIQMLQDFGIKDINGDEFKDIWSKGFTVKKGDMCVFDEACEIDARDSMSATNKDFNDLLKKNRFLGLVHFLNIPKPMSLDNYPREQRARGMVWCCADYNQDITERRSRIYFYTKETYSEIFCQKRYWNLFSNQDKLLGVCPADFQITELGDMRDKIPKEIHEYYNARKWSYNMGNILKSYKSSKMKFDPELLVKDGESKKDWQQRTGLHPRDFYIYRCK